MANVDEGLEIMHQHLPIYVTDRSTNGNISLKGNLKGCEDVSKVYISCEPAILPLEIYSFQINNINSYLKDLATEVIIVALFIIEKNRKIPNVQKEDWLHKVWYTLHNKILINHKT